MFPCYQLHPRIHLKNLSSFSVQIPCIARPAPHDERNTVFWIIGPRYGKFRD
jgi:hypothetical protein